MDAKICDKCGVMWVDQTGCDISIRTIVLSKGHSNSDRIGDYDLCANCETGLYQYLKPNQEQLWKNGK